MTTNRILNDFSAILMLLSIILSGSVFAQQNDSTPKMENQFWKTYSLVAGSVWDLGQASPIFL
jgi:hypothetical protein